MESAGHLSQKSQETNIAREWRSVQCFHVPLRHDPNLDPKVRGVGAKFVQGDPPAVRLCTTLKHPTHTNPNI